MGNQKAFGDINRLLAELDKSISDSTTKFKESVGQDSQGDSGFTIQLNRRLNKFGNHLMDIAKGVFIKAGLEMIEEAVQMVPVDTGELVESMTLWANKTPIAKGVFDDKDEAEEIAYTHVEDLGSYFVNTGSEGNFNLTLSCDKGGVELFLHENLEPYGSEGHPRAKMQNRGPKFMEEPFNNAVSGLINEVRSALEDESEY